MKTPPHIDTGMEEPGRKAKRLLASVLPLLQLQASSATGIEVAKLAEAAMQSFRRVLHPLSSHDNYIDSHDDIINDLSILLREIDRQRNTPGISDSFKASLDDYHGKATSVMEAYNAGWCGQMFPMLAGEQELSPTLESLNPVGVVSIYCNEQGCWGSKQVLVSWLIDKFGPETRIRSIKDFQCSSPECGSKNVSIILYPETYKAGALDVPK